MTWRDYRKTLTVNEEEFNYQIGKRLIKSTIRSLKPLYDAHFNLPSDWEFIDYSLGDFRKVAEVLIAFGFIHFIARCFAARHGCVGLGYKSSIMIFHFDDLIYYLNILIADRYSKNIVRDLEYGSGGINFQIRPQPIIRQT
jgi:hypothetical protein